MLYQTEAEYENTLAGFTTEKNGMSHPFRNFNYSLSHSIIRQY